MTFSIDNPRGVATTPLRKICSGKTLRRTRVNTNKVRYISLRINFFHTLYMRGLLVKVNNHDKSFVFRSSL